MRTARRLFFSLPFLHPCKQYPRLTIIIIRSSRLASRCRSNDYNCHSKNHDLWRWHENWKKSAGHADRGIACRSRVFMGFPSCEKARLLTLYLVITYINARFAYYTNSRRHGFFSFVETSCTHRIRTSRI